jgi:hypothetical protein
VTETQKYKDHLGPDKVQRRQLKGRQRGKYPFVLLQGLQGVNCRCKEWLHFSIVEIFLLVHFRQNSKGLKSLSRVFFKKARKETRVVFDKSSN